MPRVGVLQREREREREADVEPPHRVTRDVAVAGRTVLRLEGAAGRVAVFLVMPGIDRSVDITASPAAAVCALEDAAARSRTPSSRVHADTARALAEIADAVDAWRSPSGAVLLSAFGGSSFPLLGAAYDAGAEAIGTVPPWAVEVLRAPDPRAGARLAFGDRATRPVTAGLARSLIRGGSDPVDLSRLALALVGRDQLEPDHLAGLLTAAGTAWPAPSLPTPGELDRARRAARRWGRRLAVGYLTQAAADEEGRRLFTECVVHAVDLGPHAPIELPSRLAELRDCYRTQIRTAPAPPVPRTRTTTGHREVGDRSGGDAVAYRPLLAPRSGDSRPVTPQERIPVPSWLATIDGASTGGGLGFVLPRCGADLVRWGHTMANCLHNYQRAAVHGESHLVGVTRSGHLRYVVEITPQRRIRQFSGRANRAVPRDDHAEVIAYLRGRRVLR